MKSRPIRGASSPISAETRLTRDLECQTVNYSYYIYYILLYIQYLLYIIYIYYYIYNIYYYIYLRRVRAMEEESKSIYKVSRKIKKRELHSLYNSLRSIYQDSQFVVEIQSLWPELPLLANLRCGLWYAPSFHATCYFKSTDGHTGNCSFNPSRLNMHVALLAGTPSKKKVFYVYRIVCACMRFPQFNILVIGVSLALIIHQCDYASLKGFLLI